MADSDDHTESYLLDSILTKMPQLINPSLRNEFINARGLYKNLSDAIEGKPIPVEFVATSPVQCLP